MTKPVRIQLSRKRGWRMPPNTVKVSRPGKFGNPYNWHHRISDQSEIEAKQAAVELYRQWLRTGRGPSAPTDADIAVLRGKNLACWCKAGEPCHADVLLELANGPICDEVPFS